MKPYISIPVLFTASLALLLVVGCSDANAAESTYLPLYEPCLHGDSPSHETGMNIDLIFDDLDLDDYDGLDAYYEIDEIEHLDLEGQELDEFDGDDFFSQSGPFIGATPAATPASAPAAERAAGPVDLNSASAAELTTLPGIGPALAERILDYRAERSFTNTAELQRVRGIGSAKFEKIAPLVTVE